ncbi:MAG: alpha/beta fold hydrolase [Dehalococcoidia bacterium]|nr:alpha/beta fold hydrolase [Dehalococcoidia bacterium]
MMNTMSWAAHMPLLSQKFQLILMDFRDQGQSSKMHSGYSIDIHVGDVLKLLDALFIPKVHLMGLSYGGYVALLFALAHQDRLKTLMLPNTNNFIPNHLKVIGKSWEVAASLNDGEKFFQLSTPVIYSGPFYEKYMEVLLQRQAMFKALLTKEWFDGFVRLSQSIQQYNLTPQQLQTIKVPTLLIGADKDIITPVDLQNILHGNIADSEFVIIKDAGHGAFLEKMNEFMTLILGFVTKYS